MNNKIIKNKATDYPAPSVKHFPQTARKVIASVDHTSFTTIPKATSTGHSSPAKSGPGLSKGNRGGVIIGKMGAK